MPALREYNPAAIDDAEMNPNFVHFDNALAATYASGGVDRLAELQQPLFAPEVMAETLAFAHAPAPLLPPVPVMPELRLEPPAIAPAPEPPKVVEITKRVPKEEAPLPKAAKKRNRSRSPTSATRKRAEPAPKPAKAGYRVDEDDPFVELHDALTEFLRHVAGLADRKLASMFITRPVQGAVDDMGYNIEAYRRCMSEGASSAYHQCETFVTNTSRNYLKNDPRPRLTMENVVRSSPDSALWNTGAFLMSQLLPPVSKRRVAVAEARSNALVKARATKLFAEEIFNMYR